MTLWMLVRFALGLGIFAAVFRTPRTRVHDAAVLVGVLLLAVLQAPTLGRPPFFVDCDLYYFWSAGHAVREGRDPYTVSFLNPPNSLFLYTIFAFVPFKILAWAWKGFNVVGTCALVPLSNRFVVPPRIFRSTGSPRQNSIKR